MTRRISIGLTLLVLAPLILVTGAPFEPDGWTFAIISALPGGTKASLIAFADMGDKNTREPWLASVIYVITLAVAHFLITTPSRHPPVPGKSNRMRRFCRGHAIGSAAFAIFYRYCPAFVLVFSPIADLAHLLGSLSYIYELAKRAQLRIVERRLGTVVAWICIVATVCPLLLIIAIGYGAVLLVPIAVIYVATGVYCSYFIGRIAVAFWAVPRSRA